MYSHLCDKRHDRDRGLSWVSKNKGGRPTSSRSRSAHVGRTGQIPFVELLLFFIRTHSTAPRMEENTAHQLSRLSRHTNMIENAKKQWATNVLAVAAKTRVTTKVIAEADQHDTDTQHAPSHGRRHRIPVYLPRFPTHTSIHAKLKVRDRNHFFHKSKKNLPLSLQHPPTHIADSPPTPLLRSHQNPDILPSYRSSMSMMKS